MLECCLAIPVAHLSIMKYLALFSALTFSCVFGTALVARNAAPKAAAATEETASTESASAGNAAINIEGYWQIVEKTAPEAIAFVYQKDGVHYVRMVALYDDAGKEITETIADPQEKAKGLSGNPYLCGLDFIWGLKPESDGKRFKGSVTDPDSGSSYTCEVWFDEHKKQLVVRGEVLVFGENQYWPSIKEEDVPKEARLDVETIELNVPKS